MTILSVYSDGSSSGGSNKPGGYGFVILRDGVPVLAGYGGDPSTTNNIMELMGAIEGLQAVIDNNLQGDDLVEIVSDSTYVLGMAQGSFNPTTNQQYTTRIRDLAQRLNATTRWVKGHKGEVWNERADRLAKKGKMESKASGQKVKK